MPYHHQHHCHIAVLHKKHQTQQVHELETQREARDFELVHLQFAITQKQKQNTLATIALDQANVDYVFSLK